MLGRFLECVAEKWPLGKLGPRGERVAARYLRRHGLEILARNARALHGELDLVAVDGPTLVFVEVKSRSGRGEGDELTGLEKIDRRKRATLRRASNFWRKRLPASWESYRLDAVTVEFEKRRPGHRLREVRWYPGILDLDGS
jgi:putative endonuclease